MQLPSKAIVTGLLSCAHFVCNVSTNSGIGRSIEHGNDGGKVTSGTNNCEK